MVVSALVAVAAALANAAPGETVFEAEALLGRAKVSQGRVMRQEMRGFGRGFGGDAQLFWTDARDGARLELPLQVPRRATYELVLHLTQAPDYGIVRIGVEGKELATADLYGPAVRPAPGVRARVALQPGERTVVFLLAGKNRASSGTKIGIDRIVLKELVSSTPPGGALQPAPGASSTRARLEALLASPTLQRARLDAGDVVDFSMASRALDGTTLTPTQKQVALADGLGRIAVLRAASGKGSTVAAADLDQIEALLRAGLSGTDVTPTAPGAPNGVLRLRWSGAVDTSVDFAHFFGIDHTIAVRFMAQYPHAFEGPLLSVKGQGKYWIGLGDVPSGGEPVGAEHRTPAAPRLTAQVGRQRLTWRLPDLRAGEWHHLVVTRSGHALKFHLDGVLLTGQGLLPAALRIDETDPDLPRGTLRVGRFALLSEAGGRMQGQFFGLIDDLALYRYAVPTKSSGGFGETVFSLFLGPRLDGRLSGLEQGLWAGWTFDSEGGGSLTAQSTPLTFHGSLSFPRASAHRSHGADAALLPLPYQETQHDLPTPRGEVWRVAQGMAEPTGASHQGYAAFTLDMNRLGTQTAGAPLYATAKGVVVRIRNAHAPGGEGNFIELETAAGEHMAFMHLERYSVPPDLREGSVVARGQFVGLVGNTGLGPVSSPEHKTHLHMGVHYPGPDPMFTIPAALAMERRSPATGTWEPAYAIPVAGDQVRRPRVPFDLAAMHLAWEQRAGTPGPGLIDLGRPVLVATVRNIGLEAFPAGRKASVFVRDRDGTHWTWGTDVLLPALKPDQSHVFELDAPKLPASGVLHHRLALEAHAADGDRGNDEYFRTAVFEEVIPR